ncbi:glycosyltransferase [Geobacter sp. DSM 9736]|uniref:glycosyltransferase n=1 Tax=Geobacter sp. DSM 9736 TaxID=1277350 RepID=UPI000B512FD7|nr:glycosyltransferase [Geobacter sp. DSM 9736]SNB46623.1 Glycosyltransferase involved in cell wall bisynthesis [Geobacter sp. DSM 9736]
MPIHLSTPGKTGDVEENCHSRSELAEMGTYLLPSFTAENMDLYLIRSSILEALSKFLRRYQGTILDVGCGKMPYKQLVLQHPDKYVYIGLDIENPRYQADAKPDLYWDGRTMPLEDCSVDCAIATELFEHIPIPENTMREIFRVLKPGGQLFFTVPFLWPLHDLPNDEYRYTPFALERHLRTSGFYNISLKALGGWNASLAQMIGLWARRKPMSDEEREKVSQELFPFYVKLVESDEKPDEFMEGQMITGVQGTASKPLRICYILLHIPVPSETFIITEILALQEVGVDVHTVSLGPSQQCHEDLMAHFKQPVYNLSDKSADSKSEINSLYFAALRLVSKYDILPALAVQAALAAEYVITHSIQHIHSHFASEAALVALLVSKLTGITYSCTAHAYDIFKVDVAGEFNPDRRLKLIVEHAAKFITVSEYNKAHFMALTNGAIADKLEIIHYGMDLSRFNKIERRPSGTVIFLSVGRLVEKKGHEYLLRAFQQVAESCKVHLRIVGEGPLRQSLVALADELGIADKVTFVGAVSSSVVLEEMKRADVFVLHSLTGEDGNREGMPVSIMEACVTGLPVVSTRHAGIPELIVEGESGFLVAEKDSAGFAEAMQSLALSPELREKMGTAGHNIVSENFNILNEAEKLKNIFTSIIVHHNRAASGNASQDTSINLLTVLYANLLKIKNLIKRFLA